MLRKNAAATLIAIITVGQWARGCQDGEPLEQHSHRNPEVAHAPTRFADIMPSASTGFPLTRIDRLMAQAKQ